MKDCWLSPYGEVIYCSGAWNHNIDAEKILISRYHFKDVFDIDDKFPLKTATDVLMDIYEWCRYSTCANRGWLHSRPYTTDQKNKIFELTGDIVE